MISYDISTASMYVCLYNYISTKEDRLRADDVVMQPNPVYGIHSTAKEHVYGGIQ